MLRQPGTWIILLVIQPHKKVAAAGGLSTVQESDTCYKAKVRGLWSVHTVKARPTR